MEVQTLDPVHVAFIDEAVRPMLEYLVQVQFRVASVVLD